MDRKTRPAIRSESVNSFQDNLCEKTFDIKFSYVLVDMRLTKLRLSSTGK
jgi:hypothetical protein